LTDCPDVRFRDPERAIELARSFLQEFPQSAAHWQRLGVAHYRAGQWQNAVEALNRSVEFQSGGDEVDQLFLAMAHWQLGDKDEARRRYDRALALRDKNVSQFRDPTEFPRFRAEAADLLEIVDTAAVKEEKAPREKE
jgi:uncharacterized protein HemY